MYKESKCCIPKLSTPYVSKHKHHMPAFVSRNMGIRTLAPIYRTPWIVFCAHQIMEAA